jgi:hypothetical protein
MICREMHERIRAGGGLDAGHAAGCAACRSLTAEGAALGRALARAERAAPVAPPPDLDEALSADRGPLAWVRARSTPLRLAAAGALAASVIALIAGAMPREDLEVHPAGRMALALLLLGGALLVATARALRPLHRPPEPGWARAAAIAGSAAVVALLVALPAAHQEHPSSLRGAGDLVPRALACFVFGLASAAPLGAALLALARGSAARPWPALAVALLGNRAAAPLPAGAGPAPRARSRGPAAAPPRA